MLGWLTADLVLAQELYKRKAGEEITEQMRRGQVMKLSGVDAEVRAKPVRLVLTKQVQLHRQGRCGSDPKAPALRYRV